MLQELLGRTEPDDLVVADRPGEVFVVRPDVARYERAMCPPVALLEAVIEISRRAIVTEPTIAALENRIPGASVQLADLVRGHNWFAANKVYDDPETNMLGVVLNNVLFTYASGDGQLSPDEVQRKIQLVPVVLKNLGETSVGQLAR
jgi:hypothetical protein